MSPSTESRIPDLPAVIDDPRVKAFLQHHYNVSNDPDTHDEYTDLFTKDGEFSMNGKKAKGKDGTQFFDVVLQSIGLL